MANHIVYDVGIIDVTTIDHAERLPNNSVNIYRKDGLCSIRVTREQFQELAEEMKRRYSPLPSVVSTTCRDKEVERQLQEEKLCLAHSRERNNNLKQENTMLKEELDVRLKEASRIISTITAERDESKAQNSALAHEITVLKERIAKATEMISDLAKMNF